ncbi:hypothetical protein KY332_05220 [Candidatus Woesearchaeota archaeon]|nr:hypothetical protein [Candidatus Woesearchaeota archaeon]
MPNPQVHAAIGMIGAVVIVGILYLIFKKKFEDKNVLLFLPLFLLLGAGLSLIPDIPELARSFPSVADPIHLDYHDKPAWNMPVFNLCFFHPYLDEHYSESYDLTGLILTLCVYNGIALFYFYQTRKK